MYMLMYRVPVGNDWYINDVYCKIKWDISNFSARKHWFNSIFAREYVRVRAWLELLKTKRKLPWKRELVIERNKLASNKSQHIVFSAGISWKTLLFEIQRAEDGLRKQMDWTLAKQVPDSTNAQEKKEERSW